MEQARRKPNLRGNSASSVSRVGRVVCKVGRLTSRRLNNPRSLVLQRASTLESWLTNNGTKWTCDRLKLVKQAWVDIATGGEVTQCCPWFRLTSVTIDNQTFRVPSLWVGEFRVAINLRLTKLTSDKHSDVELVQMALANLNMHTCVLGKGSDQDRLKLAERVKTSIGKTDPRVITRIRKAAADLQKTSGMEFEDFMVDAKWVPEFKPGKAQGIDTNLVDNVLSSSKLSISRRDIVDLKWPAVAQFYKDSGIVDELQETLAIREVGKVLLVPSEKAKVRVVASPNVVTQGLLKPVQRFLDSVARCYPGNCHADQELGRLFAQKPDKPQLQWSFDLKDATDYFPREILEATLRGLGVPGVFDRWLFEGHYDLGLRQAPKQLVKWEEGSPMGAYGSFPSFTLAHGLLIEALGGKPGVDFFVLGDDVIIGSYSVANNYAEWLIQTGVPISKEKTLRSEEWSEFAGRLYWHGKDVTPPKFKSLERSLYDPEQIRRFPWMAPAQSNRSVIGKKARKAKRTLEMVPYSLGGLGPEDVNPWIRTDYPATERNQAAAMCLAKLGAVPEAGKIIGSCDLDVKSRRQGNSTPEQARRIYHTLIDCYLHLHQQSLTEAELATANLHKTSETAPELVKVVMPFPSPEAAPSFIVKDTSTIPSETRAGKILDDAKVERPSKRNAPEKDQNSGPSVRI